LRFISLKLSVSVRGIATAGRRRERVRRERASDRLLSDRLDLRFSCHRPSLEFLPLKSADADAVKGSGSMVPGARQPAREISGSSNGVAAACRPPVALQSGP
jgi:hypothetical protein